MSQLSEQDETMSRQADGDSEGKRSKASVNKLQYTEARKAT